MKSYYSLVEETINHYRKELSDTTIPYIRSRMLNDLRTELKHLSDTWKLISPDNTENFEDLINKSIN